jgi:colanic acid/amylovoran biosynthesis glycosyltransferase
LPVLTTRHAGIPEAITHGVHGVLLDEHDTRGITKSLVSLYNDARMRSALGRAAAQRAHTELDVYTKTRDLERIYDSVVHRAGCKDV